MKTTCLFHWKINGKSLCVGTSIELCGITHLIDLPWTEDELLKGFYDDQDVEIDDEDEKRDNTDCEYEEDKEEGKEED